MSVSVARTREDVQMVGVGVQSKGAVAAHCLRTLADRIERLEADGKLDSCDLSANFPARDATTPGSPWQEWTMTGVEVWTLVLVDGEKAR